MQHICSHYNLLFYGCSLADPDMLATLDGMIESLGSEVGPHFWLTADEVSEEKKQFLMKHYSVYTVRTKNSWEFSDVLALLINLCNIGWPIPKPLTFTALHYQISSQHGTNINIQIEHRLPQEVAAKAIQYVFVCHIVFTANIHTVCQTDQSLYLLWLLVLASLVLGRLSLEGKSLQSLKISSC
jgi:hypothetical protein